MDPPSTVLGKMLTQEITPVVMVLGTPLVEDACRKNGLSFIDMLSPFSLFHNIDVPVRTASDQAYRLQKFKLRLFYASDIQKPNPQIMWMGDSHHYMYMSFGRKDPCIAMPLLDTIYACDQAIDYRKTDSSFFCEAARERFHKVITEAAEQDATYLCAGLPKIEDKVATSKAEVLPSWFEGVNQELVHNSSFSDHEAFDHPVACLLVVSSKDEAPINKFVDLFNTNQPPSILNDGVMDPKVLKQYLLLHDNQEGSPEEASKILSEMKSTFGSNDCQLLCINTSMDGLNEKKDNPWASYKFGPSVTHQAGCFLNMDDINEIKILVQDLSTKHIIPHMEQKIRLLNQQVSATRKGFRNQIKNLWWRKGKEDTPDTSNGQMYTYSSVESQIRVLGDYAFMLQDYELALSNYRLISTDYKLDKAWKRYAGVQEMMGLAYFMLDQSRKEAENCMENAFTTYLKLGKHSQEYAIRCGLWWVEMLKAWDHYKEAASVYFRLSGEEPLLSAVMLEQASYCYLFSAPPMLRKYGFHLVLSGDSYEKCDQVRHAIRVYRIALSVLKGTTWSLIRDHIRFQLGKWFASLGMFEVAIEHMLEILACTHQSKAAQELFLKDFIQLVQKTGKTFEVCRLELPIIKLPSLKVFFEDHRTFAAPLAIGVKESTWRSLEEDLIPSSSTVKANWLELHTKHVSNKYKESNICVVGEAVKVDIGFKNPLQIPLSITSVSLVCIHSEGNDATEVDAHSVATDVPNDEQLRRFIARNESFAESSSVSTSKVDFSLSGGETLVVQLTVTPRIEGILKIVGVRWKLSGSVVGFQSFELNDAKKKNVKGRRKIKKSPGSELKFLVIRSLPRLEGSIQHFPKRSYHGELHQLIFELKNQSSLAVKNVKMKISHPRFLLVGNPEALNAEFPACLVNRSPMKANNLAKGEEILSCFHFPEDLVIQGEEPFRCPMLLRAAESGTTSLHIVIYYEVDDTSSAMRYRTLRMTYNLEVLPSLDVSFKISHCPSRLQEVLVRMDVINKTSSENFQIHQLSAVGNQWELTMLQPFDTPWQHMTPGQVLSSFFKLKNVRKAVSSEDDVSNDDIDRSHLSLGSQAGNKALLDISRSPVADFHHHEKLQREISDQGVMDSVDFILFYQPHKSGDPQLPDQSRIFSHHACHCSLTSTGPIYWQMDGPQTIHHDFSTSLCEIPFKLTIHNSLNAAISVHVSTFDPSISGESTDNQIGWHDVSVVKEIRVTTDVLGLQTVKKFQTESISPFMWTRSSSTRVKLGPLSTTEVPIQICVFTPGIYDVSYYKLEWKTLPSDDQDAGASSGVCPGRSFYITVLQSP